ncbi:MAG TPA: GAF domain-containing sensor histidine kinase [Acidimicrobiales bacterium]|nr:GAF domain-containing sensor histidine kinase [Acidimicrobiales bacterium]
MRWVTVAFGLVLTVTRGPVTSRDLVWAAALLGHATWRTLRPTGTPRWSPLSLVYLELGLSLGAVSSTGSWASPFVFCLVSALIAAGFEGGFARAIRAAVVTVVAVGLPSVVVGPQGLALQVTGQWAVELLLVAVLAGYVRRMFGEAEKRHSLALDRMDRLSEANDLLVSLHRVAQSLPATLNLQEVVSSTVGRLHTLVDCDVTAVLVRDDATARWNVAVGTGTRLEGALTDEQLPAPLLAATSSSVASLVVVLEPGEGVGVGLLSRSGLYAPLRARGNLVGLVALEHHEPGRYGRRELRLLDGFLGTAALAIDNARWFARLRTMGADEERVRIARDMHDRVGQSLAAVAFRLDRLTTRARGHELEPELAQLRTEVRGVLGDVRDTLSDLRTDVSDEQGLAETLDSFLERVRVRSKLEVEFARRERGRLPLLQERELWQIAHEAVVNVEHHARASQLTVRWECDGRDALLEVVDDGRGFVPGRTGREDSYGITGMRERADAIGATLEILAGAGGTTVRCRVKGTEG